MMAVAALGIIAVSAMDRKDSVDDGTGNSNEVLAAEYVSDYNRIFGEFTAETSSKLLNDEMSNSCYSPASLFAALALTAECTEGETRAELLNVLGVESMEQLEEMYAQMLGDIWINTEVNTSRITLANSLWINKRFLTEDSDGIMQLCEEKLTCELFSCDDIEADEVNKWVGEKTNGMIKKLLSDEEACDLALINTLYYSSKWGSKFSVGEKEDFRLNDGSLVKADYISNICENMSYKECSEFTIANVAMKKGNMIFVMPVEDEELAELLKEDNLNQILALVKSDKMDKATVNINIPIFECEDSYGEEIKDLLKDMGVESLFKNSNWVISDKHE